MKQLVILSGKGGTGKTSVAAAFAHLAHGNLSVVLADADVDAANLELVLAPRVLEEHDFVGGKVARIDPAVCMSCGTCEQVCRFDAVLALPDGYQVDEIACDGCAACVHQCPEEAIRMVEQVAGKWFLSESLYGPLFHAALRPAQENSGKLVTLVKQRARLRALEENAQLLLVDGPPGVGCPVISAVSGADLVLVVAEPTVSGVHDMQRILQTAAHFGVRALVCINKADIHPASAAEIEAFCREQQIELLGAIPFDLTVTEAMVQAQPVTAYRADAPASQALVAVWQQVIAALGEMLE